MTLLDVHNMKNVFTCLMVYLLISPILSCAEQKAPADQPSPPKSIFKIWYMDEQRLYLETLSGEFGKKFDITWTYRHKYGGQCYGEMRLDGDDLKGRYTIERSTWATCSSEWDPGCWTRNQSGIYQVIDGKLNLCGDGGKKCEVYK